MTGTVYTCLHTNQFRSYLNHLVPERLRQPVRSNGMATEESRNRLKPASILTETSGTAGYGRPRQMWKTKKTLRFRKTGVHV